MKKNKTKIKKNRLKLGEPKAKRANPFILFCQEQK
jgi:hypothetical protein